MGALLLCVGYFPMGARSCIHEHLEIEFFKATCYVNGGVSRHHQGAHWRTKKFVWPVRKKIMKTLKYIISLMLFALGMIHAMEQSLPMVRQQVAVADTFLRLHNGTHDILLVRHQAALDAACSYRTLIPGQSMDFASVQKSLVLKVKAHGTYTVSAEKLFGLTNLADSAKLACPKDALLQGKQNIKIVVCPLWDSGAARNAMARAAAVFCEWVFPYTYTYSFCEEIQEYSKLSDAFPQVAKALHDGEPAGPRHFLSVSQEAAEYDLGKAREALMLLWKPRTESCDSELARCARDVLVMVESAYLVLTDKENKQAAMDAFRQLVDEKCIKNVARYNAQYGLELVIKSFLDHPYLLAAKECGEAVVALEELKKTSNRVACSMANKQAVEIIITLFAERFFQSRSKDCLARVVDVWKCKEAQMWLMDQIQTDYEWRVTKAFVFRIFEQYTDPYYAPIACTLVKYFQALNALNEIGNTPLMEALLREDRETAVFLIDQHADRSVSNGMGLTALAIAQIKRKAYDGRWSPQDTLIRDEWDSLIAKLSHAQVSLGLITSYISDHRLPEIKGAKSGAPL